MNEDNYYLVQIIAVLLTIISGLTSILIVGHQVGKKSNQLMDQLNESNLTLQYRKGYKDGEWNCFTEYVVKPIEESIK